MPIRSFRQSVCDRRSVDARAAAPRHEIGCRPRFSLPWVPARRVCLACAATRGRCRWRTRCHCRQLATQSTQESRRSWFAQLWAQTSAAAATKFSAANPRKEAIRADVRGYPGIRKVANCHGWGRQDLRAAGDGRGRVTVGGTARCPLSRRMDYFRDILPHPAANGIATGITMPLAAPGR